MGSYRLFAPPGGPIDIRRRFADFRNPSRYCGFRKSLINMIQKAIILTAGLGTRFLPLSKVVPKGFWPLADKPILQYIVEEAVASGVNHIIFVIPPSQRMVFDYFKKPAKELEEILKVRKKEAFLERLKKFEETFQNISFSFAVAKRPLGDGYAVLQA